MFIESKLNAHYLTIQPSHPDRVWTCAMRDVFGNFYLVHVTESNVRAVCLAATRKSESLPTNKPFGCDKADADGQRSIFILLVHAAQHLFGSHYKPSDALFRAHGIAAKVRGARAILALLRSQKTQHHLTANAE